MAVSSTTFGAISLTDADAVKFDRQVSYGRPKKAAFTGLANGKVMQSKYESKGFVEISVPRKK